MSKKKKSTKESLPAFRYTPSQAQKELKALDDLYNNEDAGILTQEAYERLRKAILRRLAEQE